MKTGRTMWCRGGKSTSRERQEQTTKRKPDSPLTRKEHNDTTKGERTFVSSRGKSEQRTAHSASHGCLAPYLTEYFAQSCSRRPTRRLTISLCPLPLGHDASDRSHLSSVGTANVQPLYGVQVRYVVDCLHRIPMHDLRRALYLRYSILQILRISRPFFTLTASAAHRQRSRRFRRFVTSSPLFPCLQRTRPGYAMRQRVCCSPYSVLRSALQFLALTDKRYKVPPTN